MPNLSRPTITLPPEEWEHYSLWYRVYTGVLPSIHEHFHSTIQVAGVRATEIYTFGAVLGAVIEAEIVRTLNDLRAIWDPTGKYAEYAFERQPERFPDVLLINKREDSNRSILFGIELKSWYLLAKEGEPSFRFTVTPEACAVADLLVVVPWSLSYVVAGTPVVFRPWVLPARYVAEYRNYWWEHEREAKGDPSIESPPTPAPYPSGREAIADKPRADKGRNFGRIARIGVMDEYVRECNDIKLIGISASQWRDFFRRVQDA